MQHIWKAYKEPVLLYFWNLFLLFPPSTTLDYLNHILINLLFYFLGKKTFWNCWRFVWEVISIWVLMDKSIRIWLCRQKGVSLSILRKSPIALTEKSILQYAQSKSLWESEFLHKQNIHCSYDFFWKQEVVILDTVIPQLVPDLK